MTDSMWGEPGLFSGGFGVVFVLVAVVVVAGVLFTFGSMAVRAGRYAVATPQNTRATCVAKRTDVSRHASLATAGAGSSWSSTYYYATFETDDHNRFELEMDGRQYGMLAEGDRGIVTWRDTVFQAFNRDEPLGRVIQDRL